MKIELVCEDPREVETEALVTGVLEGSEGQPPWTVALNAALDGAIADRLRAGDMRGKLGEIAAIAGGGATRAKRVILVGLGKAEGLDRERLRRATGRVVRWLADGRTREAALLLHLGADRQGSAPAARAVSEAATLATFRSPAFGEKSKPAKGGRALTHLRLVEPGSRARVRNLEAAVGAGQSVGESSNLARQLAELPGNYLPPRRLAEQAVRVGEETGLKVTVFDETWIRKRKMGALLGVAQGSSEPPRLIVIEHRPRRSGGGRRGRRRPHIALVGKGVTFDTGGISLKPREDMDRMKYDMSGAAAVVGTMRAVSLLDLPLRVTGIIPTVENMPSGTAVKPGDVLLSMTGKSIEVINTDAEGRLILADAITLAGELKPDAIVDIATLTGACKIALGGAACGLMGNDQALIDELREAGELSGERAWPLPLFDEYSEEIQCEVADMKNTGGRAAGALTAAAFLKAFAGSGKWAHLDIAGTAWVDKDRDYLKIGAAGFGVRLLTAYLEAKA
jgi:leucyl aminopeptidase